MPVGMMQNVIYALAGNLTVTFSISCVAWLKAQVRITGYVAVAFWVMLTIEDYLYFIYLG